MISSSCPRDQKPSFLSRCTGPRTFCELFQDLTLHPHGHTGLGTIAAFSHPQTKFPHTPRLISNCLGNFCTRRENRGVKRVNVVDLQICEVRMVTKLAWRDRSSTLPRHDCAVVQPAEEPAGISNGLNRESEYIPVEGKRTISNWGQQSGSLSVKFWASHSSLVVEG